MESLYALGLALMILVNVALWILIITYRSDMREMNDARREWWDAYATALDENVRAHESLTAMRAAHDELQDAFVEAVLDSPERRMRAH